MARVKCLYDICFGFVCNAGGTLTQSDGGGTLWQREDKDSTAIVAYMLLPVEFHGYPITAGHFHRFRIPSFKCFVPLWHRR